MKWFLINNILSNLCLDQWNDGKIVLTSLQYHLLTIWHQGHRKAKETKALKVVTGGKNDKTEKNY